MNCTSTIAQAIAAMTEGGAAGFVFGIVVATYHVVHVTVSRRRRRADRLRLIDEMMGLDGRDMYGLENEHLAAQADDADELHKRGDA